MLCIYTVRIVEYDNLVVIIGKTQRKFILNFAKSCLIL